MIQEYAGTQINRAPEQISSKGYNDKVDIWTLGIIYYNMIFGSHPFAPHGYKDRNSLMIDPEKEKTVSEVSLDFIKRCLEHN